MSVRDEALRFGPEAQLVGIVSHPRTVHAPGAGLAFVILNAGVLHRVGPHRLHVLLAWHIAAGGVASLRLDLGGIGDSITTATDAASFRESAVADAREAMTGLTRAIGAERFVLFGVCSGADNSIATALVDDRVAGIVLVDPATYPTRRSQLRFLRARLAEHSDPREALRWGLGVARHRIAAIARRRARGADEPPAEGRQSLPPATFHRQLGALADRGVRVLAIYSGIHGANYNHRDQLFERFPDLRGRIDHAYFPDANHTFTELAAQAELVATVTDWMRKQFG
jgi:hypothetical protein